MTGRWWQRLGPLLIGVFVVAAAASSRDQRSVVAAATAVALAAVSLLARSRWPVLGPGLVAGAAVSVLCGGDSANVGWFTLCALAGWCAWRGGTQAAVVFTGAAVAVLLVEATWSGLATGWAAWITGTVFTAVVCLMGHRQRELIEALRGAQAGLADRVRDEERNRVARELHDLIGHSLTVSLLHLSSARLAVEEDPAEAAQALGAAEDLARQSLAEVRHAVGLLRDGPQSPRPLPGAGELPALVDGFRRAGARVAYDVVGDPARLAATTGLTVYRILQESLTNAVRHGAGQAAQVRLEVGRRSAVLTVTSGLPSGPATGPGAARGVGLASMGERAAAVGGRCTAGPVGRGWQVRAVLPT